MPFAQRQQHGTSYAGRAIKGEKLTSLICGNAVKPVEKFCFAGTKNDHVATSCMHVDTASHGAIDVVNFWRMISIIICGKPPPLLLRGSSSCEEHGHLVVKYIPELFHCVTNNSCMKYCLSGSFTSQGYFPS